MKNFIPLIFLFGMMLTSFAQPPVKITAYELGKRTNSDTVQYVAAKSISRCSTESSKNYLNFSAPGISSLYTVRESLDSIYAAANKYGPFVVRLMVAKTVSSTDSFATELFSISGIHKISTGATLNKSYSASKILFSDGYKSPVVLAIVEDAATVRSRIDSIYALFENKAGKTYDTSSYTQKVWETNIILKSTTADTLTLLNPALFVNKAGLSIENIGSGAYTLAGGYTVKDKSGSTVSSIAANTIMRLVAYYDGSAYIWLKEY